MKSHKNTPAKDIRLLFTPENRALVRLGKKTQTRRIMNPPPDPTAAKLIYSHGYEWIATSNSGKIGILTPTHHRSRYGCPQRSPVRYYLSEPVQVIQLREGGREPEQWGLAKVRYLDDNAITYVGISKQDIAKLRARKDWSKPSTSLFMLKSFARTWLRGIRVWPERLGDMTDESCIAEGCSVMKQVGRLKFVEYATKGSNGCATGVDWLAEYRKIWEDINGIGSWDDERWVWAVKFELEGKPNA